MIDAGQSTVRSLARRRRCGVLAGTLALRALPALLVVASVLAQSSAPVSAQTPTAQSASARGVPASHDGSASDDPGRSGRSDLVTLQGDTVPGAPTGLTATATGPSRIELSWTAPDSDGGSAISGYEVDFSDDGGTTWSDLTLVSAPNLSSTNTGLRANTTRHYRVAARNSEGLGPFSDTVSETTNVFVRNTGQGSDTSNDSGNDQSQRFRTGANNGGYILTSVGVVSEDSESDDFTAEIWTVNTSGHPKDRFVTLVSPTNFAAGSLVFTAPEDTRLAANTDYTVRTSVVGSGNVTYDGTTSDDEDAGFASGWSIHNTQEYHSSGTWRHDGSGRSMRIVVRAVAAAATVPDAPTGLTAAARGPARIDLSWDAPDSDGGEAVIAYKIEVSSDGNSWSDLVANTRGTGTSYSHTGLSANSVRHYRVSAINVVGPGAASATATDTTNVFVRNLAQGRHEEDDTALDLSQRFTTGSHSSGYTLTSVEIVSVDSGGDDFTAEIWTVDGSSGHPASTHARLVSPTDFAAGTLTFTAPADTALAARTTYALVVSSVGTAKVTYARTTSIAEDAGHASGWSIRNTYEWKDTANNWRDNSDAQSLRIALRGVVAAAAVPGAPTGLTASATGPARIDLSWDAPDSDGGEPVTGYKVEVSTDGNAFATLDANQSATTYSHTALTVGSTRHYRVSAINSVGTGAVSATVSDTTNVFVRNTGQGNDISNSSSSNRSQRFTTGANNGGYILTSVGVVSEDSEGDDFTAEIWTVNTSGHPANRLAILSPPGNFAAGTLTFTAPEDTTLAAETTYTVRMAPIGTGRVTYDGTTSDNEDTGFASGWSIHNTQEYSSGGTWQDDGSGTSTQIVVRGTAVVLPVSTPGAPAGLTAGATGPNRIELSWTAPSSTGNSVITGYRIEVSRNYRVWSDLVADTGNTDTTYSHTGLTSGVPFSYRVSAINSAGVGEASATAHDRTVVLVSNAEQSHTSAADVSVAVAQNFTTGANTTGYVLLGVDVVSADTEGDDFAVALWTVDTSGKPKTKVTDLTHPETSGVPDTDTFAAGRLRFIGPGIAGPGVNFTLAAGTTYAVVSTAVGAESVAYSETTASNEDPGAVTDFSIANRYAHRSGSDWVSNTGKSIRIAVRGRANQPAPDPPDPPTVPDRPRNLLAWGTSPTQIDLYWNAAYDGGEPITGYKIEVSTNGTTFTTLVAAHTHTTYRHTGLSANSTRYYRVSAINSIGTGAANTVTGTTDIGEDGVDGDGSGGGSVDGDGSGGGSVDGDGSGGGGGGGSNPAPGGGGVGGSNPAPAGGGVGGSSPAPAGATDVGGPVPAVEIEGPAFAAAGADADFTVTADAAEARSVNWTAEGPQGFTAAGDTEDFVFALPTGGAYTVTVTVVTPGGDTFTDSATLAVFGDITGHRFIEEIVWLAESAITTGCRQEPLQYCPAEPVTRAQMATFLTRALDLAAPDQSAGFDDVDPDSVHAANIDALHAAGITTGCSQEPLQYCPAEPVTRAQMATFLTRALDLAAPDQSAGFDDVDPDSVHAANIEALHAAGITTGCSQEPLQYCPAEPVTRAHMAAFLHRARELIANA